MASRRQAAGSEAGQDRHRADPNSGIAQQVHRLRAGKLQSATPLRRRDLAPCTGQITKTTKSSPPGRDICTRHDLILLAPQEQRPGPLAADRVGLYPQDARRRRGEVSRRSQSDRRGRARRRRLDGLSCSRKTTAIGFTASSMSKPRFRPAARSCRTIRCNESPTTSPDREKSPAGPAIEASIDAQYGTERYPVTTFRSRTIDRADCRLPNSSNWAGGSIALDRALNDLSRTWSGICIPTMQKRTRIGLSAPVPAGGRLRTHDERRDRRHGRGRPGIELQARRDLCLIWLAYPELLKLPGWLFPALFCTALAAATDGNGSSHSCRSSRRFVGC